MIKINWKKKLQNVSFWILILKMCVIFGQQKVIVIDPGHGGKDAGAIGINDIQERDVVLNIAKEILNLNKMVFNNKFDVYLTRYKDTLISLSDRSRLVKTLNADVFVSLHCNHAENSKAKGMEAYVHNLHNPNSKESIGLGLFVLNETTEKLSFKNRGIKFANFQVLRETIAFCPTVLLELGFMTNADEAGYYMNSKNKRAIALAILMGIYNYLNTGL